MSETTRIFVPDGGLGNNGLEAAMLANGGMGGFNNPFWAIILLAFLRNGFFGNDGWGGNNAQLSAIQDQLSTNHGQTLIMDAIKGNAGAVHELATTIGCNHNAVTAAINGVQNAVTSVGNQVGMNAAQVINAIQLGNMTLANSLQNCCCDVKQLVTTQGYENQINNLQQSNMITRGFGDIQNATQMQTSALAANQDANTRAMLAKLDQIEDSRKDREIATLTAQLATVNARAERAAELAPIVQKLNDIQCKQPNTVTIPYSPVVGVPQCVAWNTALYGNYPYNYANGQWS